MKKWIIIIGFVVLLIAAVIVGVVVVGGKDNNQNSGIGVIDVDGQKIKVVVAETPPEVSVVWEKPFVDSLSVDLRGKITNISGQKITFSVSFLLDGQQVAWVPPQTLEPAKSAEVKQSILKARVWGRSVLEIKTTVSPATTATPTPTTTTTPTPTTTPAEWPITGQWTVQGPNGSVTIIYRETDTAKGKVKVWMEGEYFYMENLLDKKISLLSHIKITRLDGRVENYNPGQAVSATPREIQKSSYKGEALRGIKRFEAWFDVAVIE